MADYIDFTSDNINVFMFLIDKSNSMEVMKTKLRKVLKTLLEASKTLRNQAL